MDAASRLSRSLTLIGIFALAQISPARVREWAYQGGAFQPAADSAPASAAARIRAADLDRDGAA